MRGRARTHARLEQVWEASKRTKVLSTSVAIIVAIATVDWLTKPYLSLGFLYLFPIVLLAGFLPRWAIPPLGVVLRSAERTF